MSILCAALLSFYSCSNEAAVTDNQLIEEQEESFDLYAVNTAQFATAEMQLTTLQEIPFHEVVKATGSVKVPPESMASIGTYFEGTVKQIKLLPGSIVNQGDVLFRLENPEFVEMQQAFLEAKNQLLSLKSDFERQEKLYQNSVSSQKNFIKAESDYHVVRVRHESLAKKLTLMGVNTNTLTTNNITTSIAVRAPIAGQITSINIGTGSYLQPSQVAMTIVNTENLMIELTVFEKDLAKISKDQTIEFTLQNGSKESYQTTVQLINKQIDSQNRTVMIHSAELNNEYNAQMSPGMYVEADIICSSSSRIGLPESAVVDIDGTYYILVLQSKKGDTYLFKKQELTLGKQSNSFVEVENKQDFADSIRILSKGAFNLIAE